MKKAMSGWISGKEDAQDLRRKIQRGRGTLIRRRRMAVCSSFFGIASMAVVTLYQMGILRRLVDPPIGNFASEKVNTSTTAWGYCVPDGTLTLLAHALNITLSAAGGEDRAQTRPILPIMAAGAAGVQAAVAAKYLFYQMPYVEKAWCPYCIVDATAHLVTFGLVVPEAGQALQNIFNSDSRSSKK